LGINWELLSFGHFLKYCRFGAMHWLNKKTQFAFVIFVLLLCYFPLCHKIDSYCVQLWDESRNASNAVEMYHNHHWLVRYFEGRPDDWELKPPFLIWCQVLSFKLFGFNELALRMPTMIFTMGTVLFLINIGFRVSRSIYPGSLAAMVLVSNMGYVGEHIGRTGDHDAALIFFTTLFLFHFYQYLQQPKNKYLVLWSMALFLGWFTKSVAIFMVLPGCLVWVIYQHKLKALLTGKKFWIGALAVILLILGYYAAREMQTPGYFKMVWMNEIFGRYFGVSKEYEFHNQGFWFYVKGLINGRFEPWFAIAILAFAYLFKNKNMPERLFLKYLFVVGGLFLVVISAGTKNFWYDGPLFPIAALIIGLSVYRFVINLKNVGIKFGVGITFCCLFLSGYSQTYNLAQTPDFNKDVDWRNLAYYLRDNNQHIPRHLTIVHNSYFSPYYLYVAREKQKGNTIIFTKLLELKIGDSFLCIDKTLKHQLDSIYKIEIIDTARTCVLGKVLAKK
jgi:4-amino-4-deoxy-L-arabinose transferase-like glycosyltransferase